LACQLAKRYELLEKMEQGVALSPLDARLAAMCQALSENELALGQSATAATETRQQVRG
jgi:hypothetical protein